MTGCSAVGCRNRNEQGFKMYTVPQGKNDQYRKKIWLSKIKRKNLISSNNTRLCEVHFEKDQFEVKNPRKLKPNAIPTIFSYPANRRKGYKKAVKILNKTISHDHAYPHDIQDLYLPQQPLTDEDRSEIAVTIISLADYTGEESQPSTILSSSENTICATDFNETQVSEVESLADIENPDQNQESTIRILNARSINNKNLAVESCPEYFSGNTIEAVSVPRQKGPGICSTGAGTTQFSYVYQFLDQPINSPQILMGPFNSIAPLPAAPIPDPRLPPTHEYVKKLKQTIFSLQKKVANLKKQLTLSDNRVKRFLNSDQCEALKTKRTCGSWSEETVERALKLRLACGFEGYQMLLDQGIPLPSERTLRNKKSVLTTMNPFIMDLQQENGTGMFRDQDKLQSIKPKGKSTRPWSDESVEKATRIYDALGSKGYQVLLEEGLPLPCEKTLRDRPLRRKKDEQRNTEETLLELEVQEEYSQVHVLEELHRESDNSGFGSLF